MLFLFFKQAESENSFFAHFGLGKEMAISKGH